MHGDDGFCSSSNLLNSLLRIKIAIIAVDVAKDWSGACEPNGVGCGDEGVVWDDDLVSWTYLLTCQGEENGDGPAGCCDSIFDADELGEELLEFSRLGMFVEPS